MKKIASVFALMAAMFLPQIVLAQTTLLSDDFETGAPKTGWVLYRAGEELMTARPMAMAPKVLSTGGNFVGYLRDSDYTYNGAAIILNGTTASKDYSIEADVYCYAGQSPAAYTGIVFYADSSKGTYIKIVADFGASQRIRLYNNRINTTTMAYTFDYKFGAAVIPGGVPAADGWHKFKVEARTITPTKAGFWCYYDNQLLPGSPVYDTSVNVMTSGQYGLFAMQQNSANSIPGFFDNVVVKPLPATSVRDYSSLGIPASMQLLQNYPNPFNPETKIAFALPADAFTTLTVFDALGRSVRTLVSSSRPAGYHEVIWDSKDQQGRIVPSGVYFYSMKSGSVVETKKMMLTR